MIAPLWLVASFSGQRALVVPLMTCGPCGQDMPADHECPDRSTAPAATEAVKATHETRTRVMKNRICIRRPVEARAGDVIVARPVQYASGPAEAGQWIVTACTPIDGPLTRIDYLTPNGGEGVLVLTAEQWIAVATAPEPLLTEAERAQEYVRLSEDDCGHVVAYVASQYPDVFDAAIAAFSRYRNSARAVA